MAAKGSRTVAAIPMVTEAAKKFEALGRLKKVAIHPADEMDVVIYIIYGKLSKYNRERHSRRELWYTSFTANYISDIDVALATGIHDIHYLRQTIQVE